jgi:DNA-binding GntR family transcriptional regulator
VEIQPNRGAQVRAFSVEEATRILQVREVLEGLAAALAAEKATAAQLAELHDIVAEMEQTLAADDLLGHLPLVGRFHQQIIEVAGNEFIDQFLNMLRAPLIRHQFRVILVPGRKDESLAEHREILTYLARRDATAAERAMRRHIAALRNSLQQASRLPIH